MNILQDSKLKDIIDFIIRNKIRLVRNGQQTQIQIPKGVTITDSQLTKLKQYKDKLITYFFSSTEETWEVHENFLWHEGKKYYRVLPAYKYWLDDKIDSEFKTANREHGMIITTLSIDGAFNTTAFAKAVDALICRHESLRTTFHYIQEDYFMYIHPSPQSSIEFYDITKSPDISSLKDIYNFNNHRFDLSLGPLFVIRLIKISDSKFIFSFKTLHVLFDTWSEEILLRDLLALYCDYSNGVVFELPVLKYQLKECLSLLITKRDKRYEDDETFWKSHLNPLPNKLSLPFSKNVVTSFSEKVCRMEPFSVTHEAWLYLKDLAKSFSTSVFVILQATFNFFLSKIYGIYDIIVGSYIHGRKYHHFESQIGYFARLVLIRTVLLPEDNLMKVIEKTLQANQDMTEHDSCTLESALQQLVGSGEPLVGNFWKINIQYSDIHMPYLDTLLESGAIEALKIFHIEEENEDLLIQIDLQLQFINKNDVLSLEVYYDSSLYGQADIRALFNQYLASINDIAESTAYRRENS